MSKQTKQQLPSFETAEQIMADRYMLSCVQEKIDHINNERDRVSEGGKKQLKPSPVEFLISLNKFNKEFIIDEYLLIRDKKSSLSAQIREFITLTIKECVGETFNHYQDLFQKQNKKNSKSKKNETAN